MIKLKNITKFYDNKVIISDLSLDFHKGKITSIIGEPMALENPLF